MNNAIEISVVIPSYNCMRTLPTVVTNLIHQTKAADGMEIIIINDGSTDGTKNWLEKTSVKHPDLMRYFSQKNRGAAATRNRGLSNANGRIILFLDADVIPAEDLIREHVAFHRRHPEIHIALRGNTIDVDNTQGKGWIRPSVGALKTKQSQKTDLLWIEFITGNVSLKRKFIIDNKLRFNENLFPNEDIEFGFRAKKCGMILPYGENAVGFHDHPQWIKSYLNKGKLLGRSYALWYYNFPGLREELEKFDLEHFCGFIGADRPIKFKVRQHIKRIVANAMTAPIFLFIGNILFRLGKNKNFFWFYRQVSDINFRKAFRQQMTELWYDDKEPLGDFIFHPIFSAT